LGSRTSLQQNPQVLNWGCHLTQVDCHNGCKMVAEMPTLPFPPGGSHFYARNTASRIGCKSPVFHTTLFQNQNDAHIYLFNERKPPVQVAHEVSREFRLFTNIKIWRTVRLKKALWSIQVVRIRIKHEYRSIKRSIVSHLTLRESHLRATNMLSVQPRFPPFSSRFWGPGLPYCHCSRLASL